MTGQSIVFPSGLPSVMAAASSLPLEAILDERDLLEQELRDHGAVLIRGFRIDFNDVDRFTAFVAAVSGPPLAYVERSSPRQAVEGRVYTATEYPRAQPIFLHNEQSYNLTFPSRLHFWCRRPADRGGMTTLADTRQVLEHVPDDLRDRLGSNGYRLVRHLRQEVGLSWQQVFQTESREVAEAYCSANDIELTWLGDDQARTVQRREVVAQHPVTAELAWFNHCAFFHVSTMGRRNAELLRTVFGDALPNCTSFGDGSPLLDADCERLRRAYLQSVVDVNWQRGDVLIVDNLLVSHGRAAYEGSRDLVVAMTGATRWADVQVCD